MSVHVVSQSVVLRSLQSASLPTSFEEEMYFTSYLKEKTVPDEPAPVSGRGVRSKRWRGGVEHGKYRATRGRAMHVYVRGKSRLEPKVPGLLRHVKNYLLLIVCNSTSMSI